MGLPTASTENFPRFDAAARVLILAPHPDDESIASGGLIQQACAAGAAVRVLLLTDGDANVWPQRFIEKRWRIDAAARARWGARRRAEARAAMKILGLQEADAEFFGYVDLGLTAGLMRGDGDMLARLRAAIDSFAPTHLVLPTLADRHPDHSATQVLVRLALRGAAPPPQLLGFAVHGGSCGGEAVTLTLTAQQQQTKRQAILAHATQMRLSRKRFVEYAGAQERFHALQASAQDIPQHPLRARADARGRQVCIEVDRSRWNASWRGLVVLVVLDARQPQRLRMRWQDGAATLPIIDTVDESTVGDAHITRTAQGFVLEWEARATDWQQGFVKLARRAPGLFVLDRFGWQAILRS